MKLIARRPCSFGGKDFFIGEEIPSDLVLDPKKQESMDVLAIANDGKDSASASSGSGTTTKETAAKAKKAVGGKTKASGEN